MDATRIFTPPLPLLSESLGEAQGFRPLPAPRGRDVPFAVASGSGVRLAWCVAASVLSRSLALLSGLRALSLASPIFFSRPLPLAALRAGPNALKRADFDPSLTGGVGVSPSRIRQFCETADLCARFFPLNARENRILVPF